MCVEELAKVCGTTAVIVSAHTSLCAAPIFENGTEEQKMKYLPDLCSGKKIGAFGLTEPGAGTDAQGQQTTADAMDAVARSLPALWRADKLQSKAAKAGFEFADVSGALDKLDEETRELREAAERGTNFSEELGDVLFAAVKAGRFLNVDPEDALNATCEKFIARFRRVEEACAARGAEMSSLPLDELTRLWNEAKHPTE